MDATGERFLKHYQADRVHELARLILKHKKLYYAGKPEISDVNYDKLEEELQHLAPDHPVLQMVGAEVSESTGRKAEHDIPMLSLDKTYSMEDLQAWVDHHDVVGMWKVDGNSLSLVYEKGKLILAKTRGNGRIGEDVSEKVRWVADLVPQLTQEISLEIRGELYLTEEHFGQLVEAMVAAGLERPTNPRNIVAGLLGRKTHYHLVQFCNFFAFEVLVRDGSLRLRSEMEKFSWLETQGFRLPYPKLLKSSEMVQSYLDEVRSHILEGDIGLDGAVFSYNDLHLHEELGNTAHHPRYKMSFKWQGDTAVSQIEKITWATSRLGIVTPVAVIHPLSLSGATITNVTLHNAEHVKTHNLKAGDEIEIVRSGEVIPKFLEVKKAAAGHYQWPDKCPACHEPLTYDNVRLKCLNASQCPAQQSGAILNWVKAVEIDDLSEKRLEAMLDSGLVTTIPDLYSLSVADFLTLPLTKEKMAKKLWQHIQKSKTIPLARFLMGLGIEGAGLTTWEKIIEHYPSLEQILNLSDQALMDLDGFAEKSAHQICQGLHQKRGLIRELLHAGVKPYVDQAVVGGEGPLKGKVFAITGALTRPRTQIEDDIKRAGGRVSSSISKHTYALVTNETDSGSSKMKKARELNIKILSEADLMHELERLG